MAESTPELRIRAVLDASGARQELASLQADASRGISVGGTFAGESARGGNSITAPAPPVSSIASGIFQSPQPPLPAVVQSSPLQNLGLSAGMMGGIAQALGPGVAAQVQQAIAPPAQMFGPPSNRLPVFGPPVSPYFWKGFTESYDDLEALGGAYGGRPPPMPTSQGGGVGGRGGSPLGIPIGAKGLTYAGLIHAAAITVQNEEAYRNRLEAAGGSSVGIANAELRRRNDYDHLFFGVGRIGRAISDLDPSGASSGSVETILNDVGRQDAQISRQEQSLGFFRGLAREADVASAPRGAARHFAQIDAQTAARRDKLQAEIRAERDSETSRYGAAVAAVEQQRATALSRNRTGAQLLLGLIPGSGLNLDTSGFDDQISALGREHGRLSGLISGRETAGLTQINSIDAAEKQETKQDVAAQRAILGWQTAGFNAIAGGARGRAAGLGQLQAQINGQVDAARLRNDENLPQIEARGRAQFAAAKAGADRDGQMEQFRLQADTQVSKLRTAGHGALAHLLAASAAGGLAVANADPDDQPAAQANANAGFQGAVGDVVRQGASGIAQWVRRRTAEGTAARRDVLHTAELQAQQGVAELQAGGKPVAAGIAGIIADTKLAVQALKTDDPQYTAQRDALRGIGVARLKAYQNSLADAGQAVEVAPGTIAPGVGSGRYGSGSSERDVGKQIADAIKEAMGAGKDAPPAGNMFQQLLTEVQSLKSLILGG